MITTMIYKEVFSYIKGFHFYPLTVILLTLFIFNGIYFTNEFKERKAFHDRYILKFQGDFPEARYYILSPGPELFCCSNDEKHSSTGFFVSIDNLQLQQKQEEKGNVFLPISHSLDWTFIVQIIFSLLVLLLSYNSISEEIENKTLLLTASNAVSRWQIYLSKFISIFLTASAGLLISFLAGLSTILILNEIPIDRLLVLRLGLFFIISLVYGTLFIFIGMGCSVITRRSTLSLLVSMLIWLILVILLPESIGVLIKSTQNKPSDYELARMYENTEESLMTKYIEIGQQIEVNQPITESEWKQIEKETQKKMLELEENYLHEVRKLANYILDLTIQRIEIQRQWRKLSPAVLFRDISEKLLYAGNFRFLNFLNQVRNFTSLFQEDMIQKYGDRLLDNFYVQTKINDEIKYIFFHKCYIYRFIYTNRIIDQ